MKCRKNCKRFLLSFAFLALAVPLVPQENSWLGFARCPRARDLCEQWVLGSSQERRVEIHWREFATRDEPARVAAFYARKDHAAAEKNDDGSITLRHGEDRVLSIYAASGHYPTCERKARADEKTVILVSEKVAAKP
jgi:hypothetical protein